MTCVVCVIDEGSTRASIADILQSADIDCRFTSPHHFLTTFAESPESSAFLVDASPDPHNAVRYCRMIRKITSIPILVMISPDENPDLPEMISSGADDFMILPVRAPELVLRLNVLFRRQVPHLSKKVLGCGQLVLDVKDHRLWKNGEDLPLSPLGFQILAYFLEHVGEVVTKSDLTHHVWKYIAGAENSNLVETGITRLRRELGESPKDPVYIHTVWGKGYRFEAEGLEEVDAN